MPILLAAEGTTNTLTCTGNYSTALRPGGTGTTLTLSPISDRIVNVGKAVILKSNSANIFLTSSNSGTTSVGGYEGNSLRGTTTTIPNPDYGQTYVLNKGGNGIGFYKLKSTGTIGAHKAYLTYSGGGATTLLRR